MSGMRLPVTAALISSAVAVSVAVPAIASAFEPARTDIGAVPVTTAAAQLSKGLPSNVTKAWASATLAKLTVRADGTMTGYSRDLFPHWRDASTWGWPVEPNNSCDARNAALYRDGQNVTMSSTCTYLKGTWVDPYGARKYNATSDIDIDHIVPLAASWRAGAASWDTTKRTQFANDPLVLVSSYDRLNSAKGDKGPEAWVPPNTAAHCLYAKRWVAAKSKYALSVNSAEKAKLTSMLATCTS